LDDCRETWRWWRVLTRSVFRSKGVKAAQSELKVRRFGLFVVLLGRISTGSSISAPTSTDSTDLATFYHFVPHLNRKSFIVKQELDGGSPTPALIPENTMPCG
jgi:hypothetical protein